MQEQAAQPATPRSSDRERRSFSNHSRRPQGYHPDDASGVRQIYRGPDLDTAPAEYTSTRTTRHSVPPEGRTISVFAASQELHDIHGAQEIQEMKPTVPSPRPSSNANESQAPFMGQRSSDPQLHAARPPQAESVTPAAPATGGQWPPFSEDRSQPTEPPHDASREVSGNLPPARPPASRPTMSRVMPSAATPRPVSPFSQALVPSDSTRGRRAQDDFDYQQSQGFPDRRSTPETTSEPSTLSTKRPTHQADPAGPAWLYAPPAQQASPKPI